MIPLERWCSFEKQFQLLQIGAEFERARTAEETGISEHKALALARAIELIDLTLADKKWNNDKPMLEGMRKTVQEFLTERSRRGVAVLYQAL